MDVGGNTLDLRGASVDAVEACRGDLGGAVLLRTESHHSLDSALTVRAAVSDHDGAPGIL